MSSEKFQMTKYIGQYETLTCVPSGLNRCEKFHVCTSNLFTQKCTEIAKITSILSALLPCTFLEISVS